ncbi:hypothetical protein JNW90_28555 [Micromonospora sp. STR1s_5]|nr:hypothetical protein [Micromonospora sp. STR1s_5]MBM0206513.1 hypothetical protein [Micromonospora sp. STR1s_5]
MLSSKPYLSLSEPSFPKPIALLMSPSSRAWVDEGMAYKVRAVVLGASGKAELILERWELKSLTLAQAKAEFDVRRWITPDVQPTAFELLDGDTVILRRRVHGRNNYGPWSEP